MVIKRDNIVIDGHYDWIGNRDGHFDGGGDGWYIGYWDIFMGNETKI
jgi:hypothetical protein